jgi:hypothetical protein
MLEGVNMIETITRPSVPWYIIAFVIVLGCLILADFIVALIRVSKGKKHDGMLAGNSEKFAIIGDAVLLACTIFSGIILYNGYNTIETTYRVAIDESVSLVEFRDHYEILLEDGNEYIIREIAKTEDN